MNEPPTGLPSAAVCDRVVAEPTLLIATFGTKPEVFVQWFCEKPNASEATQLRFPVSSDPTAECWRGNPERFKVIFLGQLKDWPHLDSAQRIAEKFAGGDGEKWLLWAMEEPTPEASAQPGNGTHLMITMTEILVDADGTTSLPRMYLDQERFAAAVARANPQA